MSGGGNMKSSKKIFFVSAAILIFLGILYFVIAQEAEQQVTQGEFAIKLVNALGLYSGLTISSPTSDYLERLKAKGIEPEGGFQPDKIITKEERADLIIKAFKLEPLIEEKGPRLTYQQNRAVIIQVTGNVQVRYGGKDEWIKAEEGMALSENDYIRTGEKSIVDLTVGITGRIRIKENSELLLKNLATQSDGKRESVCIYLAMGEMIVDTEKVPPDSIFLTTTPTVTVGVRGTIYNVKIVETQTEIQDVIPPKF